MLHPTSLLAATYTTRHHGTESLLLRSIISRKKNRPCTTLHAVDRFFYFYFLFFIFNTHLIEFESKQYCGFKSTQVQLVKYLVE